MSAPIPNLIKTFVDAATRVETTIEIVQKSPKKIREILHKIISSESKIIMAQFRFIPKTLLFDFEQNTAGNIVYPNDIDMAHADYGITDCFAGIAQTGSVCVLNDDSMSGSFSLFPKNHIVLLDSTKIVPRPRDIFLNDPYKKITLQNDFIFISGSSATADMGPLVRGVHGPGKLYVIILK